LIFQTRKGTAKQRLSGLLILACHIDVKHPMWNAAYLEQTARLLGGLRYNAVLFEVENKLQFVAPPEVSH
jgi:hypothetical protein